jgi:hypothetical protein
VEAYQVSEPGRSHSWERSPDEHRERHKALHTMLDELLADYLIHHRDKRPSTTTLLELMEWSYAQTLEPTEIER